MVQITNRPIPNPGALRVPPPHDIDDFWLPLLVVSLLPLALGIIYGLAAAMMLIGFYLLARRLSVSDENPEWRRPERNLEGHR